MDRLPEDAGEEHRTLQAAAVAAGLAFPTPPRPRITRCIRPFSRQQEMAGLISPACERLLADWLRTVAPYACPDARRGCCCGSK